MDNIFEQYGKIIASVVGIIIAFSMVATAGGIISTTFNMASEKIVNESKIDW